MDYKTYLTACAIEHKIDLVEKAIEYMETVPLSTECYNAIVDMLKYEKHGLIENFKHLKCCPTEEELVDFEKMNKEFVWGRDGSPQAPEGTKSVTRDDFLFSC